MRKSNREKIPDRIIKLSRQKWVHCVAFDALEEERVNPRGSDDREMLDKPYTTKDRNMENIQNRQWRKKMDKCLSRGPGNVDKFERGEKWE